METYIVRPCYAMLLGICLNVTLEVDVVAFLDVIGTQCGAQREGDLRRVCAGEMTRMHKFVYN